jgi:sulfur carrier protein
MDGFGMITLTINGKNRSFEATRFSIAELVSVMGLQGKRIAIECNGEIVPRAAYGDMSLTSGDKLEIVGAVGGG